MPAANHRTTNEINNEIPIRLYSNYLYHGGIFHVLHPALENAIEKTPTADTTKNRFSVSSPAYHETVNYHQWLSQNKKLESTRNPTPPAERS